MGKNQKLVKVISFLLIVSIALSSILPLSTMQRTIAFAGSGEIIKMECEANDNSAVEGTWFKNYSSTWEWKKQEIGSTRNYVLSCGNVAKATNGKTYSMQFKKLPAAGTYAVNVVTKNYENGGLFDVYINGNKLGSFDRSIGSAYTSNVMDSNIVFTSDMKDVEIKFVNTGKGSANKGHTIAIDYIEFERVDAPINARLEFEDSKGDFIKHTNFTELNKALSGASNGHGVLTSLDAALNKEYSVEFANKLPNGTYSVSIISKDNNDRGIFEVSIGDVVVGVMNCFSDINAFATKEIGEIKIDANMPSPLVMKFKTIGSTATLTEDKSFGYRIALDCVDFTSKTPGGDEIEPKGEFYNPKNGNYSENDATLWKDGILVNYLPDIASRITNSVDSAMWNFYPEGVEINKDVNLNIYAYIPANNINGGYSTYTVTTLMGVWEKKINTINTSEKGKWVKILTVSATGGTGVSVKVKGEEGKDNYVCAINAEITTNVADEKKPAGTGGSDDVAIYVNQIGYDSDKSKRATIPNAPNGTKFVVMQGITKVFEGTVENNIADFSTFVPEHSGFTYRIECLDVISNNFMIGINLIQKETYKNAIDFMDESRQDKFDYGNKATGYGWRDSHQFSFELQSLALMYMSNPAAYEQMNFDIEFYTAKESDCYNYTHNGVEWFGKTQTEPDIVWLLKYGAFRYYDIATNPNSKVKAANLDMLIKEQLAYFLFVYPYISQWVCDDFYTTIRDFTIAQWSIPTSSKNWYPVSGMNHNLFTTQKIYANGQTNIKGIKGSLPPAHSIVPNLMMYEVIKRDGINSEDISSNNNAERYMTAAIENTNWILDNIDLTDVVYAKGQRMSEHIVIENLTYFLKMYPDKAPKSLYGKIVDVGNKMVLLGDNIWDMRMATAVKAGDSKDYYTGGTWAKDNGFAPSVMNEPGNVAGFQACALAISSVLGDEHSTIKNRLSAMGIAAIDDLFGRNPRGRAGFYDGKRDINGVDLGWDATHLGGYGHLEVTHSRIDATCKEDSYINGYNPSGVAGYSEGWVAFNTAWNSSIAYSAANDVAISVDKKIVNANESVVLTLKAPLNFDYNIAEKVTLSLKNITTNETRSVVLTEKSVDDYCFEATLSNLTGGTYEIAYGYDVFEKKENFAVKDENYVEVNEIQPVQTIEISGNCGANLAVPEIVVLPTNATIKDVVWSSGDDTIVSIVGDSVTLKKEGKTQLIATSIDNAMVSLTFNITVGKALPIDIELSSFNEFIPGNTQRIIIENIVYGDNSKTKFGDAVGVEKISYFSSDRNIATVDENGVILARRYGESTISIEIIVDGNKITKDIKVAISIYKGIENKVEFTIPSTKKLNPDVKFSDDYDGERKYFFDQSTTHILLTKPKKIGNYITLPFDTVGTKSYIFELRTKENNAASWKYGEWKIFVDEQEIRTLNLGDGNYSYRDVSLGIVENLPEGTHIFKLVANSLPNGVCPGAFANFKFYETALEMIPIEVEDGIIAAKKELNAIVIESYDESERTSIQTIVSNAILKIEACETIEQLNTAVNDSNSQLANYKTTAQKLKESKTIAKQNVENDFKKLNMDSYSAINQAKLLSIKAKFNVTIDSAATISVIPVGLPDYSKVLTISQAEVILANADTQEKIDKIIKNIKDDVKMLLDDLKGSVKDEIKKDAIEKAMADILAIKQATTKEEVENTERIAEIILETAKLISSENSKSEGSTVSENETTIAIFEFGEGEYKLNVKLIIPGNVAKNVIIAPTISQLAQEEIKKAIREYASTNFAMTITVNEFDNISGKVLIDTGMTADDGMSYVIAHWTINGVKTIPTIIRNNKIYFEADSFSPFMLMSKTKETTPSYEISNSEIFWKGIDTQIRLNDNDLVVVDNAKNYKVPKYILENHQDTAKTLTLKFGGGEVTITKEIAARVSYDKSEYTFAELSALCEEKPVTTPKPTPIPTEKPTEPPIAEKTDVNLTWLWILLAIIVGSGVIATIVIVKRKKK